MDRTCRGSLGWIAGLATLAVAAAGQAPPDWVLERLEASHDVASVTRLDLHNPFGDLRIRPNPMPAIESLAVTQGHREDPRRAEVVATRLEGTLRLEVRYHGGTAGPVPEAWRRRRVDLSLLVPADLPITASTTEGLIEIRKTRGDLTLRSQRGPIVTTGWGSVDAESAHGNLRVELLTTSWRTSPRLATVNGGIIVVLPREARARVRLATRGEISTDFSLEIERDLDTGYKTALAQIGGDGMELTATSTNGAIRLKQSLLRDP